MIFPFHDDKFNPSTRLFIDFFLHDINLRNEGIADMAFCLPGMRFAFDRGGSILGPYMFESIQRKPNDDINKRMAFSIRFGYAEIDHSKIVYFYTPLREYNRRES